MKREKKGQSLPFVAEASSNRRHVPNILTLQAFLGEVDFVSNLTKLSRDTQMSSFLGAVIFPAFHLLYIICQHLQLLLAHERDVPFQTTECSYTSNYCNSSCLQELGANFGTPLVVVNCSARNLSEFPTDLPINTGKLALDFNSIPTLNVDEMKKIRYLKELMIEGNSITFIREETFQSNFVLQRLNMGGNKIHDLNTGVFKGLKNLLELYLYRNCISRLRNGTFENLISLISLDLSENNILVIDTGAFASLRHLRYLDLSGNKLGEIFRVHFSQLPSLTALNLGFNNIYFLESKSFSFCLHLKILNLSHNNLTSLPKEVFKPLKGLANLDLSSNQIEFIPLDIFSSLRDLKFLNLSFSSVRVFHGTYLKTILPHLTIYVHRNPLDCTCDMRWLKEWFRENTYRNSTSLNSSEVRCAYPNTLRGRSLSSLSLADLSCSCEYCQRSSMCVSYGKTCNCTDKLAVPSCSDTCQFNDTSRIPQHEMICSFSQGKCFCSNASELCVDNAYPTYFNLSLQCACKTGYQGNGFFKCTDVDECEKAHNACSSDADCINTVGSYQCVCLEGYHGDGVTCHSIKHRKTVAIVTATVSLVTFVALIGMLIFCVAPKRIQQIKEAKQSSVRRKKKKQSTRRYVDLYKIHELGFTNAACTSEEATRLDEWEIPREKLHTFRAIGEGAFGVVMEGIWDSDEGATKVAVKTLKPGADRHDHKDLMAELSIMIQAGSHPNIVSLLGACSVDGPLYLVMELVSGGNLLAFLRNSRCQDQHYINIASSLNERELLKIAKDVSDGMNYLSSLNLVHRDLAARNVLLTEDRVAKVTDFGLARDVQLEGVYTKTTTAGRLPVKWMAPESIRFHIYTSKSDVWSFGVLLWEIISIGECPYPGIPARLLARKLMIGYRMKKPTQCSDDLYEVMKACWQIDAEARPTFAELANILHEFLARTGRAYINLGGPEAHLEQVLANSDDLMREIKDDECSVTDSLDGLDSVEIQNVVEEEHTSTSLSEFERQFSKYVTTKL